jgi:hypothetical protein
VTDDRTGDDRRDGREEDAGRDDRAGADLDEVVAAVDEHLAATAELPVSSAASTRLGEAAAVVRDLARRPPADPAVTRERLAVARDLLAEVDGTGSPAADERVAAARDHLSRALDAE